MTPRVQGGYTTRLYYQPTGMPGSKPVLLLYRRTRGQPAAAARDLGRFRQAQIGRRNRTYKYARPAPGQDADDYRKSHLIGDDGYEC